MTQLSPGRAATVGIVFLLALLFVGDTLYSYNNVPSGYVAVYPVLGMWIMTLLVALAAAILMAIPRTRFVGFVLAATMIFIPCAFFVGVKLSELAGFNRWRNAPMVHFGPDIPADFVVYYKMGASRMQIADFERAQLHQQRSDNKGDAFRPAIHSFLRLAPSQAHGHDGFAIDFDASSEVAQRTALIESISNAPLVFMVYMDVAPNRIPDPDIKKDKTRKN